MRQTTLLAIFLVGLISMTVALTEDESFIKTLKNQKFGRTILETIQIELKTGSNGNSVDTIVKFLKQLRTQDVNEQAADFKDNTAKQLAYKKRAAALNKRITSLKAAIKKDSNLIVVNKQTIVHKELYVVEQKKIQNAKTVALAKNRAEKKSSIARYNKAFNGLSAQLIALASALQSIRSLQVGNSFAQISSQISEIKFQHPKYQSMINVLSQLMGSDIVADQKMVKVLINIIVRLQAELRKELELLTAAHKVHLKDIATQAKRLRASIKTAKANIVASNAIIANLQKDNVNASLRIANNNQRLTASTKQLIDTNKMALNRQRAYNANTERRTDEINILDKVIDIFTHRFTNDVKSVVAHL